MNTTTLTIHYRDTTERVVQAEQVDVREMELWAMRRDLVPPRGRSLLAAAPTTAWRVIAWAACNRLDGKPADWSEWDASVGEVIVGDDVPVDPTPTDSSGD